MLRKCQHKLFVGGNTAMKKIVAIGGGEIRARETEVIDREIIRLSGRKKPELLFIPTASSDAEGYWETVQKYFGGCLGCRTDVLFLIKERLSQAAIKKKILSADIVYVGGGNTLKMMRRWRRLGVDRMLQAAYRKGVVLCGMSAGSICWFEYGHSDSMSFYHPKKWKHINVKGLGFIRGIHCPHYNGETRGVPRRKHFRDVIRKIGGTGIAIDDRCAIEFVGDRYRVVTAKPHAAAYRVYKRRKEIVEEKLEAKATLSPVSELYETSVPIDQKRQRAV